MSFLNLKSVVISFKISIFALADTAQRHLLHNVMVVVISFKISIFALADTAYDPFQLPYHML